MNRLKSVIVLLVLTIVVVGCSGNEPAPTVATLEAPAEEAAQLPAPIEEPAQLPAPTEEPAQLPAPTEAAPPTVAPTAAVVPTEAPLAEPAAEDSGIIGITWQWEEFQEPSGVNSFTVLNPESYTLTLQPDGIAAIQADCNQVQLAYNLEGNSLSFAPAGPSTLAFCGEGSLDGIYLQQLSQVVTYVADGDKLYLNLMADAGNMIFSQGGLGITPEQISLDTQGLSDSWQAVIVPETPYDESQPPGPKGLPEHMEILFGVTDPSERQPNDPIMTIIPVNAYREMWDEAGNSWVSETMAMIEQYSFALPAPAPTSGMPALPPEMIGGGVNDLAVQLGRAVPQQVVNETSATQTGYRFVGRWVQDANPVTNQGLRYVYQGFTNDGLYLVSFLYPVSTAALPDDVAGVTAEEMALFNSDPQAYMTAKAEQLNGLAPSDWEPDLATLDALVASLQITDMPVAGIQDETWVWTALQTPAVGEEAIPVANPALYQVIYHAEGVIELIADCNKATLPYSLTASGMAGGMLAQPGPMTLAECGPESQYNAFINNITAAQNYRVRAGGKTAQLILSGGTGIMFLARLEELSEGVTLPTPEEGEGTATVIAPAGVNVRTGPGSEYEVLGVAAFGQTGTVVGVSQDQEYWVINVPGAPDDQGWVSAEFVTVENADSVPVIPAPPVDEAVQLPTIPTATAAVPMTPVATSPASPLIEFEADTTDIDAGETATLSWSVENIQAVYMYPIGGDYTDYPVEGQGSREVEPGITTSYELLVFVTDDSTSAERIEISVDDGLTSGQWILGSMSTPSAGIVIPIQGTELTAEFESNGDLSGSAGCNSYSGGFTAYDEVLNINSPLATGQMACTPDIMGQEQLYLSLMEMADSFMISSGQLSIFDGSGNQILNFIAG